jgi:hypothetical protein
VITANGPTTFCEGDTVILTSSQATGNTWSTGQTAQSILVVESGTYTVQTAALGCSSPESAPIVVTVNVLPEVPVISPTGTVTVCADEALFLFSSSQTGNVWSTGATTSSIPVTATGSYTVSVTNGLGCTATSLPMYAVIHPLPDVTLNQPGTCVYSAPFTLTGGSPAGGTYAGTGVSDGIFSPAVLGVGSTVLTYTYTDANGCTNSAVGSIFVDDCAGVDELGKDAFNAYPNPSDGHLTITSPNYQIEQIVLYAGSGKLVRRMEGLSTLAAELDLSELANGVYNAEIYSGKNMQRMRLVINK